MGLVNVVFGVILDCGQGRCFSFDIRSVRMRMIVRSGSDGGKCIPFDVSRQQANVGVQARVCMGGWWGSFVCVCGENV